jgi:hypothetical protein
MNMEKISSATKNLNTSIVRVKQQATGLMEVASVLDVKVKWFKTDIQ